jgi:hypothetical protein
MDHIKTLSVSAHTVRLTSVVGTNYSQSSSTYRDDEYCLRVIISYLAENRNSVSFKNPCPGPNVTPPKEICLIYQDRSQTFLTLRLEYLLFFSTKSESFYEF